ncbi:hypothetical protein A2630_01950 [Candidatus Woesebacteria bacterium RIFCSPHIGHO2_01_FULL_44_10]|uniref:Methyltransferase domain-containing protein n=1 Tax=Candidatus Woesebacteria bacterium RIFCSPLOWO2_01_FULL_44_14 TaxID=1802525 RepID=A0A1F8C375_9BACT|nr:MAG: hypothetical protein A2630_01950 [Candidatus Woesebacteria bacterium RIFCSPHIGHO2_01_FULL_44_10]OGM54587.1 MAG: hypothetical protein A3F62_03120 [Candidatus Woesebacteria bacterium RIFCSPHIGHO2_12_FULL_44_11]OGM70610.1 MAG: hypothetical protein A2975_00145 [Candidatus Woesebacteria bacterium RIFCSPLOWO2_01_FULL_44_14]
MNTKKWYQEAVINGVAMPFQRHRDTSQKRWERFIRPLLPSGRGLLVDLGCNAGFYMRKAADLGFTTIGVEIDEDYLEHARYWESQDPRGVTIIKEDISKYDLPACQVALLANVHYWLTKPQLTKLVNNLKERVLSVIVVGRHARSQRHKSPCDLTSLRALFSDFIGDKSVIGYKHYSVIFINPRLTEKNVDEVFNNQPLVRSRKFLPSFSKLIDDPSDPTNSDYYRYLKWRGFENPKELLMGRVDLIADVRKNGIKNPLLLGRTVNGQYEKDRLSDGDHRIVIAKKLGIKKVICKIR